MKSDVEVKIADIAQQDKPGLEGTEITVQGYLVGKAEEPLDDGYNYPFIDENENSMLVKSARKLDTLERGKWFHVTGKLSNLKAQEMHVTSDQYVEEVDQQPETQPQPRTRHYFSSVKKVVDGDTIHLETPVLGTTKIRFVSIDTPETNYYGDSQGYYAEEATRQLQLLLPLGEKVEIEVGEEPFDQYGRLLAVVRKNERNINEEMIAIGMAVPYFIHPNLDHFEAYGKAVVLAKKCGKGLWNPDRPIDELPYEFRFNKRGGPNKYVGHYDTKEYVDPERWESIPIEHRVFFLKENDAVQAGYTKRNESC